MLPPGGARQVRERSWRLMEQARKDALCRFIDVANYPVELLLEMKEYATD